MKPHLVDIIIPRKEIVKVIPPIITYDYTAIIFNICCFIFISIGIYILYIRKENKELNKLDYKNKVTNLYNRIYNKI